MSEHARPSSGHDELRDLCRSIDALVQLLESVGEEHWAEWLQSDLQRLRAGDTYALRHLLQAFGGMGSLTDLMIHPLNGHEVTENEAAQISERLNELRGHVYRLGTELERIVGDQ